MRDHSTSMEIDRRACDPRREGFGNPLLLYRDPADPVRKAVHVYWTVAHMRQHPLGDAAVVVDQLVFRDPVVGEEEFVWMGDGDHVSVNGQHVWQCSLLQLRLMHSCGSRYDLIDRNADPSAHCRKIEVDLLPLHLSI